MYQAGSEETLPARLLQEESGTPKGSRGPIKIFFILKPLARRSVRGQYRANYKTEILNLATKESYCNIFIRQGKQHRNLECQLMCRRPSKPFFKNGLIYKQSRT